jgi:SAM-dependent methyltransferase
MKQNSSSSDWAGARGEKWRAQMTGMEATMAPIDAPLIDALELTAPCKIADLGCGGGRTALEVLRRAPAGSVVHGFDVSPAILDAARARIPPGERALAFELADVAKATPPQRYDRLLSRFGLMFFEDPAAAFGNLRHWLARGGRFAFAVWGPIPDNPWMVLVRGVVSAIVELAPPNPDGPGPFRYADASKLVALLEAAGFEELAVQDHRPTLAVGGGLGAAEAARFALGSFSTFAEDLAAAGADAASRAQRDLAERFSAHLHDGQVRLSSRVHIVTGLARG